MLAHNSSGVRSVATATSVLDCFLIQDELGPTSVARELGIAKSTAHGMLSTLASVGLLERLPSGRYRLALRLFQFGQVVLDRLPLRQIARPILIELHDSVREMAQLGLPANGHVIYVERVGNSGLGPLVSGEVMRRVPGYASSAGRAMAAFDDEICRLTDAVPKTRLTPFTIVDPVRAQRILDSTRTNHWVRSSEESAIGYTSVAAPVFAPDKGGTDCVVGAISVVGKTSRITGPQQDFYVASVRSSARRVTELMRRATL